MAESLKSTASYTPILLLARGGVGEVEIALRREGDFRRLYAIKRLREGFREDQKIRDMFLAEARIAGLIRHSNVVSVLDMGEDSRGPFLIMDYIEGISVSHFVNGHKKAGKEVPLQLAFRIGAEAARGLHAAHTLCAPDGTPSHVVHRDVSPQNILLGFDGITRLTDFGVAKALGHLVDTEAGVLKGKFSYMSPEQLRFRSIDARSDIFSLGIVLYEMLAGRRLYAAEDGTPEPQRILEESPPDIGEERSDLPPEVVALFFRLLAKDPDHRPDSAKEVAQTLDALRVPMEADQGVLSLADYLETRFSDRREKQLNAISKVVESIDGDGDIEAVPSIDVQIEPATVDLKPDARTVPDSRRSRRSLALVVGLTAALLFVIVIIAALGFGLNQEVPENATLDPPDMTRITPVPVRNDVTSRDASPNEASPLSSTSSDAMPGPSPTQSDASRRGNRRENTKARVGRRRGKRSSKSSETPRKTNNGSRFDLWPMSKKAQ